jgi:hypothetical protein
MALVFWDCDWMNIDGVWLMGGVRFLVWKEGCAWEWFNDFSTQPMNTRRIGRGWSSQDIMNGFF